MMDCLQEPRLEYRLCLGPLQKGRKELTLDPGLILGVCCLGYT